MAASPTFQLAYSSWHACSLAHQPMLGATVDMKDDHSRCCLHETCHSFISFAANTRAEVELWLDLRFEVVSHKELLDVIEAL